MLKEKRNKRYKERTAATKIQSVTRTKQAKKRVDVIRENKKRGIKEPEPETVVEEKEVKPEKTSEEEEEDIFKSLRAEAAAIKLQAFVRSGLTRVKVLSILEELIAELEGSGEDLQNLPSGAVGKRIEAMNKKKRQSMMLVAGDPKAFAKRQEEKKQAAIKIQCMVRGQQARTIKNKLATDADDKSRRLQEKEEATRLQKEKEEAERLQAEERARLEQEEATRKSKLDAEENAKREVAAIKIQACIRSTLSRMKVCKMVDAMISALLQEQDERVRIAQEALDAAKRRDRDAELAAEETLRRQKQEEEADAIQKQKDIDDATLGLSLFCGPLPFDMELLPQWWMDHVPHNTGYIDSGYESPEFHQWRMEQIETYGLATKEVEAAE